VLTTVIRPPAMRWASPPSKGRVKRAVRQYWALAERAPLRQRSARPPTGSMAQAKNPFASSLRLRRQVPAAIAVAVRWLARFASS